MAFFYSFTESLKQKWLDFFQANRDWIKLHMQVESVYTPDGGKRPPSYLMLGVVNALEPKLAQLMLPFSKLNADADTLIEVLGLHFDPDIALGNSAGYPDAEIYSGDDGDGGMDTSGFAEVATAQGFSMEPFDTENQIEEPTPSVGEETSDVNPSPEASFDGMEEFGDVSFDADVKASSKTENASLEDLNDLNASSEENGFSDVLMDVWGEEGNSSPEDSSEADSEMLLGEEFTTGAFDDSEIARLFPNS